MNRVKHWLLAAFIGICSIGFTVCCVSCNKPAEDIQQSSVQRITERGTLLVGTTGDYRPLSYCEPDSTLFFLHQRYGLVYGYDE